MDNPFNTVEMTRPETSWFDLTHNVKQTGTFGTLMPIQCLEVYPGDKFRLSHELLVRTQPLVAPVMDRFDAFIHTFMVPWRIIWTVDNFEKFMKGDGTTVPYLDQTGASTAAKTLHDYLGYPSGDDGTGLSEVLRTRADLFCAYQRIFYEYYRDQNLSTMTDNDKPYTVNGNNNTIQTMLRTLRKRSYTHDYFTSALPFTQKGTEASIEFDFVDVPVKTQIVGSGGEVHWTVLPPGGTPNLQMDVDADVPVQGAGLVDEMFAKTSNLSGTVFTINDFRLALATQHWLERMAIGGTRLTEIVLAHFGVTASDRSLQRPEYIGGLKTAIVISEVQNTTGEIDGSGVPQGTLAGHGLGASYSDDDTYTAEDHGVIMSIMSIMPKATYWQGVNRCWDWEARNARNEWLWPEFATLGEQAIRQREIYADIPAGDQEATFGYTGRYNELRSMPNRIAGEFKSTLNYWSAARTLPDDVTLSEEFLTIDATALGHLFGVSDLEAYHPFIIHILNKVSKQTSLPKFGTPKMRG